MHSGESLADAEKKAIETLDSELNRHGKLNMHAFNLIGATLSRLPIQDIKEVPLPQKIAKLFNCQLLKMRLRCQALAVTSGRLC